MFPSKFVLSEFLRANRSEIIALARKNAAARLAPQASVTDLEEAMPVFLDQLVEAMSRTGARTPAMQEGAVLHGAALLKSGFTCAQLVHDYGSLGQAITGLAQDMSAPISPDEFKALNGYIDDAIAGAVTEYTRLRDESIGIAETERLGFLAHELRNPLGAAMLAYQILRTGTVGISGSTGTELGRSLRRVSALIDKTMAQVRLDAGVRSPQRVSVFELIEDLEVGATMEANARELAYSITTVKRGVDVNVDKALLAAAVGNLLQNAFKFTRPKGRIALTASATTDRVRIDVEDECGGLPPGKSDELFRSFRQTGLDRSGLGLGLSISRRSVEANGGKISVRDVPGTGCVFTIDLPRE